MSCSASARDIWILQETTTYGTTVTGVTSLITGLDQASIQPVQSTSILDWAVLFNKCPTTTQARTPAGLKTPSQLWSTAGQGWRLHATLSRDELHTILTALEHCFPDTHWYLVAKDLEQSSMARLIYAAPTGGLDSVSPSTPVRSRDTSPIVITSPLQPSGPLQYSSQLLEQARVPTGVDRAARGIQLNEAGNYLGLITHLRGIMLWYSVEVNTTAQALTRWGALDHEALGRALRSAPLIFIPSAYLQHHAASPSGRWWACSDVRKAPTWQIGPIQWVFAWVWVGPSS
eukprot:2675269-Rhodomonas_salina.1